MASSGDSRSRATTRLVRAGFTDSRRATQLLGSSGLSLLDDDGMPRDAEAAELVDALGAAPDPELATLGLGRLLDAAEAADGEEVDGGASAEALRTALHEDELLRTRLLSVLGTSAALGDVLARHPEQWQVVRQDADLERRHPRAELEADLLRAVGADPDDPPTGTGGSRARGDGDDVLDALRVAYRRRLLGLAARDLAGLSFEDVACELADLAGAALQAGLAVAAAGLPDDAAPCRLAVLALGKCGGRELNYVSDVDVIVVAEPADGADEHAALQTATTLVHGVVRACSATTSEGSLWPVDLNLRPEGRDGALVRTLASYAAYYERWARAWEFQALLKARPVAGDLELGQSFVETASPHVWTAGRGERFVEDVQAMRRRVEEHVPSKHANRQLKLGPGGLRDIEFAVQLLQLVHGTVDTSLRSGTTLSALQALADGGYVGREDARRLHEAYRWLRGLEHRMQLHRLRRTAVVPEEPDALRRLARSLGVAGGEGRTPEEEVEGLRLRYSREVRRLHGKLFYRPLLHVVARLPEDATRIQEGMSQEAARTRLTALGFADPAGALRHVAALTEGVSRRAAIQRTLLPAMLETFADSADPDSGLLAYRKVSDSLGGTPWYLRSLRDEGEEASPAALRLARVLSSSAYVADLLTRAPDGVALIARDEHLQPKDVEALRSELGATASRHGTAAEAAVAAVRGLRRRELLRVSCGDLLEVLTHEEVTTALSDVAAATLDAALGVAVRVVASRLGGTLPARVTVVSMGRTGGWEAGYGSDVDVLFVHEPVDGAASAEADKAAEQVVGEVRRLLSLPAPDPPLTVDAGLRPDGRQGPLTRSMKNLEHYWERYAAVWEAQAMLRARPVAGDADLGARFLTLADGARYPEGGLSADQVREVRRIKARVDTERLPRGVDRTRHLKLGRGGLADVEWTVQLLQLQHAYEVPGLRTTRTLAALEAAVEAGLVDRDDADQLATAWRFVSRVRDTTVLVTGKVATVVPSRPRELRGVAQLLGYAPDGGGAELVEEHLRVTRRARAVVEKVFYG